MAYGNANWDAYLEANGLLNYQTQGLTADQIAAKYAAARVNLQPGWAGAQAKMGTNRMANNGLPPAPQPGQTGRLRQS